jgi:HEAT repeat protein
MPRRPNPAEKLREELLALRADPTSEPALQLLRKGLASATGLVVEAAARIVGEAELDSLAPLLASAFPRFVQADAVKRDPGCRAKVSIVQALVKLRVPADEVFLAGIRHRQLEPAFGGPADTAAMLRGHCAMGLALMGEPSAPVAVAELLADPEAVARAAAVQALTCIPPSTAEPLLRYKIRVGDEEPQVAAECFRSLLAIAPSSGIAVVAGYLGDRSEELAEQAALALGESRLPEAFPRLHEVAETAMGSLRRVVLLAIAMLRSNESRDYLLERVAAADATIALQALDALAIYRHDAALRERVLDTAARRGDAALLAAARERMAV